VSLSSKPESLLPDEKPTPNPNLVISFKCEGGDYGPIHLYDTAIIDPMSPRDIPDELHDATPGITSFGFQDRDVALALATYYGCRFEES
jgi:hypothetical protein